MTLVALALISIIILVHIGFLFLIIPKIDLAGPRWAILAVRYLGMIVYVTGIAVFGTIAYKVYQGAAPWWSSPWLIIAFAGHVIGYLFGGALMAYYSSPKVYDRQHYEEMLERRLIEIQRELAKARS